MIGFIGLYDRGLRFIFQKPVNQGRLPSNEMQTRSCSFQCEIDIDLIPTGSLYFSMLLRSGLHNDNTYMRINPAKATRIVPLVVSSILEDQP